MINDGLISKEANSSIMLSWVMEIRFANEVPFSGIEGTKLYEYEYTCRRSCWEPTMPVVFEILHSEHEAVWFSTDHQPRTT